jgi:DNA (cytosine-5)-methyltransferase 1
MEQLFTFHLFAGAGGGILADALLGHWPVGAVEIEPYPGGVLLQRQRDGLLPPFPVWDDVSTFRADNPDCSEFIEGLRVIRDQLVICGGFPCQDISAAGKGAGLSGARSGLWGEMARIVREVGPRHVFVENSPMLTSRGMGVVLGDLAAMGFDARGGVLGACCTGALHKRERVWVLASDPEREHEQGQQQQTVPGEPSLSWGEDIRGLEDLQRGPAIPQPQLYRLANEVPDQMDRLRAAGNGQVPAVAALAWQVLND